MPKSLSDQLRFIQSGMQTVRYHTEVTLQRQTVGQHSCGVALLCDVLTEGKASADLLRAALVHDLAEHRLGDMPAPAKRELGIRGVFQKSEDDLLHEHDLFVGLTDEDEHVLKIADAMDGMLNCIQERRLGNTIISYIYNNFDSYVYMLVYGSVDKPVHPIRRHEQVFSEIRNLWSEANGR
jgi:5'-deoxynucleotidase YfbR-like HD superfamily hydrolase